MPGSELCLGPAGDGERGGGIRCAPTVETGAGPEGGSLGGDTGPQPHHLASSLRVLPTLAEEKAETTSTSPGGWETGEAPAPVNP